LRDEDFRAVLVIAGAEGSRDVVARDESEAKPVARRLMFLRVVLKVVPQVVGERVFGRHVGVEDARELRPLGWELWELKMPPLAEAYNEDALTMLGNDALCIDNPVIDGVAERFGKSAVNDFKCLAPIVPLEVLHVLEDERGGPMKVEDVGDREEEITLLDVLEAVLAPKTQFL
jgi:hypothetical protein